MRVRGVSIKKDLGGTKWKGEEVVRKGKRQEERMGQGRAILSRSPLRTQRLTIATGKGGDLINFSKMAVSYSSGSDLLRKGVQVIKSTKRESWRGGRGWKEFPFMQLQ